MSPKSSVGSTGKPVEPSAGVSLLNFTKLWALDPLDAEFGEPEFVTGGHPSAGNWTVLRFERPQTVAFPWEPSGIRALCHGLLERLPSEALPQLLRTIEELGEYYALPISVTPTSHLKTVNSLQGKKHAPPVLDLAEG